MIHFFLLLALGDSAYEVADPLSKENAADYLIVAPAAFVSAIDPLADYRAKQGYRVAIVTTESLAKQKKDVRDFVRYAAREWKAPAARFLLLVGDADAIPSLERRSAYQTKKFANDEELGTDHLYGVLDDGLDASLAVGRFPADTKEEVATMAAKTIEYERDLKPGAWQKKINFVTGEAGFHPIIDAFIEAQFTSLVSENIPPGFDLEVAYSKPTSRYCPFPAKYNEHAVRLLNEGTLFYVYVGHGHRTGFDSLVWNGQEIPMFDLKNVKEVEVRNGLPVMFVIACSTGHFDSTIGDCIGEELVKRPRGPVGFVGGSRITQPYSSALFGRELIAQIFHERCETLGWSLVEAKKKVLADDFSKFRMTANAMAGGIQGPGNLEPMRRDCVLHYNLLGDPALRFRRPGDSIRLSAPAEVAPRSTALVKGTSPIREGRVRVALEVPRTKFAHPLPRVVLGAPDFEERITERYRAANDKVVVFLEGDVKDGAFEVSLPMPHDLAEGDYFLKVTVLGELAAIAATSVRCVIR